MAGFNYVFLFSRVMAHQTCMTVDSKLHRINSKPANAQCGAVSVMQSHLICKKRACMDVSAVCLPTA